MEFKNRKYSEKKKENFYYNLRVKKKLSQYEMAVILNVSQSYYSKIENDKLLPDFMFLKKLRSVFKININKLLEDVE